MVLLLAIYWKGTSSKGAIWAMITTGAVGLFWVGYKAVFGSYPIHPSITETYAAVAVALVSTIVYSLIFKKKESEQAKATKA